MYWRVQGCRVVVWDRVVSPRLGALASCAYEAASDLVWRFGSGRGLVVPREVTYSPVVSPCPLYCLRRGIISCFASAVLGPGSGCGYQDEVWKVSNCG